MPPDDRAFADAVAAAPDDDTLRLVYADWLDERDDPGGAYLRAEVAYHATPAAAAEAILRDRLAAVDPVWAADVSRPPHGIAVPGLTFSDTGPPLPSDFLARAEEHFGRPFPPDYVAFLTRHNGGVPNRPAFQSDLLLVYGDVRFFSSADTLGDAGPILLRSAGALYDGGLDGDTDPALVSRVVLIAEVDPAIDVRGRFYLGLRLDEPPDGYRVVDVWDVRNVGLGVPPDVGGVESFAELLAMLRESR